MKERKVREIISGFPYPIISFFIKLRTDECLDPGPLRLKYILSTAESICRFLGMVAMCECREYMEVHDAVPSKSMSDDFKRQFSRPNWGTWLQFAQKSLKWLDSCGAELTMPEMIDFFFTKIPKESEAASALGELLRLRNDLSHEKIQAMMIHHYTELCEKSFPLLERVLEYLDFLLDYELAFVSQIEVNKQRKTPPTFLHRLSRLLGDSDAFPGDRRSLHDIMDSNAILLMSLKGGNKALNLDPLLVSEPKAGKAPDIFFYNGMNKPEKAEYSACKHGGGFVAEDSERAEAIAREIAQFIRLFSPPEESGEVRHG